MNKMRSFTMRQKTLKIKTEIPGLKDTMTEIKTPIESFNGRLDQAEELVN